MSTRKTKAKMDAQPRKPLNAKLDAKDHDRWHDVCGDNGITVTAALQVFAEDLPKLLTEDRVKRARTVTKGRRRRNELA